MKSLCLALLVTCAVMSSSAQSPLVLVAQSKYEPSGPGGTLERSDTIVHIHHDGRSSVIDVPILGYGYPQGTGYKDDTAFRYGASGPVQRYSRTFNSAGLEIQFIIEDLIGSLKGITYQHLQTYNASMLIDTIKELTVTNPNITIGNMWTNSYYNNNTLKVTTLYKWNQAGGTWHFHDKDSFATMVVGNDSISLQYFWNGTGYDEEFRHKLTRDANKRILSDTMYHFNTLNTINYYSYNQQGKLVSDSIAKMGSLIMEPYEKHSYTYDAQGRMVTDSTLDWDASSSQFVFFERFTYNYNAQSNLTSLARLTAGQYNYVDSFIYNNDNQLVRTGEYEGSGSNWKVGFRGIRHFYYGFPTKVDDMEGSDSSLQLYPVPATSYVNVHMSFVKPQPFSVALFDMQGRLLSQWQEAAQQTYNKQIPVLSLTPGQYTIHILAGEESCSKPVLVVR